MRSGASNRKVSTDSAGTLIVPLVRISGKRPAARSRASANGSAFSSARDGSDDGPYCRSAAGDFAGPLIRAHTVASLFNQVDRAQLVPRALHGDRCQIHVEIGSAPDLASL